MRVVGTLSTLVCSVLLCQPAAAIVGDAEFTDWGIVRPALMIAGPKGSFCSAAIIGHDLLLTAAHCVAAKSECIDMASPYGVSMAERSCVTPGGFIVSGPGSTWIAVTATVPHPQYNMSEGRGPDLAVVKLAQPLPSNLAPALLATRPIRPGDQLTIVGYGVNDSGKLDRTARMATFTVDALFRLVELTPFGNAKLGAAKGDSGAPVFDLRLGLPLLVGIATRSGVGAAGRTTTIERIEAHRDWIWTTAQQLGSQLGP
jgi:hypothetical protein